MTTAKYVIKENLDNLTLIISQTEDIASSFFKIYSSALLNSYLYCFTLYIAFCAILIVMGKSSMPFDKLLYKIFIGVLIYWCGVEWNHAVGPLYHTLTNPKWTDSIMASIGMGYNPSDKLPIFTMMDTWFKNLYGMWIFIGKQAFYNIVPYAIVGFIFTILMAVVAMVFMLIYSLSMIFLAIAFGVAPFFIICLFFDSLKSYFMGWLRTVISLAFIPILLTLLNAFIGTFFMLNFGHAATAIYNSELGIACLSLCFALFWGILYIKLLLEIPSFTTQLVGGAGMGGLARDMAGMGRQAANMTLGAANSLSQRRIAYSAARANKVSQKKQNESNESKKAFYDKAAKNLPNNNN